MTAPPELNMFKLSQKQIKKSSTEFLGESGCLSASLGPFQQGGDVLQEGVGTVDLGHHGIDRKGLRKRFHDPCNHKDRRLRLKLFKPAGQGQAALSPERPLTNDQAWLPGDGQTKGVFNA